MAGRRCALGLLLVAAECVVSDASRPQWSFWPTLPQRPAVVRFYERPPASRARVAAAHVDLLDPATERAAGALAYGSILLHLRNATGDAGARAAAAHGLAAAGACGAGQVGSADGGVPQSQPPPFTFEIERAVHQELRVTADGGATWATVGLQGLPAGEGAAPVEWDYRVALGTQFTMQLRVKCRADSSDNSHAVAPPHAHWLQVAYDRAHGFVLAGSSAANELPAAAAATPPPPPPPMRSLRVATYNVWNTNPPAGSWPPSLRAPWYTRRLQMLAHTLREMDAGVVALQEVRVDSSLALDDTQDSRGSWLQRGRARFGRAFDNWQVLQLAELAGYDHFVFQPAHLDWSDAQAVFAREEEGVAVLSRWPVVSTSYTLLSRHYDDPNDAHTRVCLRASVAVPGWGLLDVYVTHLALGETARERSVQEIMAFVRATGRGRAQVLMGDLNAEPQERSVQYLLGRAELGGDTGDFKDAWLEVHTHEPEPGAMSRWAQEVAFTFSSDFPRKRIDYVLARGDLPPADAAKLFGQGARAKAGASQTLLSRNGPHWASDHRALAADFTIFRPEASAKDEL